MQIENWGMHWFRRDLRIPGNEALKENWKRNSGRTLGIFCFDSKFLSRSDFSHNRFAFFINTMKALKEDLREQGGDLLVVDCLPHEALPKLLNYFRANKITNPSLISWNRDYEPFARERDAKIENLLKAEGISTFHARDHLLFEPQEVLKSVKPGDFYQIYSPFARKWFEKMASAEGQLRLKSQDKVFDYYERKGRRVDLFKLGWSDVNYGKGFPFKDALVEFDHLNQKNVTVPIPEAGFFAAFRELQKFKFKLDNYKEKRDFPAVVGTSKLSIFLKNGSITVAQIISTLNLMDLNWNEKSGRVQFLKELVWREFYYSILYHQPDVEKKSFLPHYENIAWENNEGWLQSWKEGTTGFPIVDAGMRELATTGWMHNRVRMIVASFLTKDLLIDWRWGENYFMKELLDGDLAPNNGGWQWAASTGCDPQPYFRIFNPWLQGQKFDPEGEYIKKFVKELRGVSAKVLHDPDGDRSLNGYPLPIVHHSKQRKKALLLYEKH
jgi:deoxyribodipyrimidine photo-lyase